MCLTGLLVQAYVHTVIWAYTWMPSVCMMHNCAIYSSRYHNFASKHIPKFKLTVCKYACASEPARHTPLENSLLLKVMCAITKVIWTKSWIKLLQDNNKLKLWSLCLKGFPKGFPACDVIEMLTVLWLVVVWAKVAIWDCYNKNMAPYLSKGGFPKLNLADLRAA